MKQIAENLHRIHQLIQQYEKKYARAAKSVKLLAVSKKHSFEKMLAAYEAGQRAFGESYLQEALDKKEFLSQPDVEWHFIGPIQTNKTRKLAENFSWVHGVASKKIAQRLNDQRPLHLPPLNICIEINVSHEASKFGIDFDELFDLANHCLSLPNLHLRGLMTIPAANDALAEQRKPFHQLAKAYQSLQAKGVSLDTLSMGMSEDFEAAIAEGSTIVRIGSAIFGQRNT